MRPTSTLSARRCDRMPEREAILLVRLDGVGDAALCIPALEGLRRAFAQATFGAVCSPANAALFSQRISSVHIYDARDPVTVLQQELQAQHYTRALIATEEVAGYQLGRLCGAPRRAGFWHRFEKPFKSLWQRRQVTSAVYRPAAWKESPEHEVVTLYRLAAALGATLPVPDDRASLRMWLNVETSDQARAAKGMLGFQISPKLLSGEWGPSALARIIIESLTSSGYDRGALIAAAADEALACSVMEHMPVGTRANGRLEVLTSLSLPRWLGVLDSVDVLVTPDTGAAHVAGMLGVPVVDIFDEPNFVRLSSQWRPWAGHSRCMMKARCREGLAASLGRQVGDAILDLRRQIAATSTRSTQATR